MIGLRGARVLVTAGGSGIGAVLAHRFSEAGAQVAICDQDTALLKQSLHLAVEANVTDEAQMDAVFARVGEAFGGVDIVCANAGTGGPAGPLEALDYTAWKDCVAVNLHGAFLTCRGAARRMKAQGSGVILITSSTAGLFGYPNRSPYAAAKWGLIGLTKTLAMELGPHGIRVNAICPGSVEGDRMERVLANESRARGVPVEELRQSYVRGVSMKTWVTADQVADTALFLASDAGKTVSGQAIAVDGHTETLNA